MLARRVPSAEGLVEYRQHRGRDGHHHDRPPGTGLAEDPVQVRAALGALALGHARAILADDDVAGRLTLRLALHAVELTRIRLVRHSSSLFAATIWGDRRRVSWARTLRGPSWIAHVARHILVTDEVATVPCGHETRSSVEPFAFPCERTTLRTLSGLRVAI